MIDPTFSLRETDDGRTLLALDYEDVVSRVRRTLVEAEESAYRGTLVALGWAPPEEARRLRFVEANRDAEVASLRQMLTRERARYRRRRDRDAESKTDLALRIALALRTLEHYDVLGARAVLRGEPRCPSCGGPVRVTSATGSGGEALWDTCDYECGWVGKP